MNMLHHFNHIKTIVMDMDGVLTDGNLYVQADGTQLRSMNIKDGYALQLAVKQGYKIIVMSGATCHSCQKRLEALGIEQVYMGVTDKAQLLKKLSKEQKFVLPECIYIGDDMPDLEAMKLCGIRACPQDACIDIQMAADYISPLSGGKACVRDILEKMMKVQQKWS